MNIFESKNKDSNIDLQKIQKTQKINSLDYEIYENSFDFSNNNNQNQKKINDEKNNLKNNNLLKIKFNSNNEIKKSLRIINSLKDINNLRDSFYKLSHSFTRKKKEKYSAEAAENIKLDNKNNNNNNNNRRSNKNSLKQKNY